MAANRTGTGKTEPEPSKPNRLRFITKPEKPETGETETGVLNRFPKTSMGITGVPFGRTEVLVPPPEPHERALARGKRPRGPAINRFREKCKNVVFCLHFVMTFF